METLSFSCIYFPHKETYIVQNIENETLLPL